MSYHPPKQILEKYADLMVNFAAGGGKGIKKGDVVRLAVSECAKPFFAELRKAILKSGGHLISQYLPDDDAQFNLSRDFYDYAQKHQLNFFPKKYFKGLADEIDHSIFIISDTNPQALKGVEPKKMMARNIAMKPFQDWLRDKENAGKYSWTLSMYGTPAMAKEARLSEKEYWNQIIKACYLDKPNPIAEWKRINTQIKGFCAKLNKLEIEKVRVQGPDVDLQIKIGEKRKWAGGSDRNIPSFEIFTSPDWRETEGWVKFNQPLYRYGNIIENVELEFKNGCVVKSRASKNEKVLKEMISVKNADKIGEFSLTDSRFSRITKFMAETLFDENVGGPHGNTHIALGNSYHDCYKGDIKKNKKADWAKLGYNDSAIHTDIVSTTPRVVTATLKNGKEKVIYTNGKFTV